MTKKLKQAKRCINCGKVIGSYSKIGFCLSCRKIKLIDKRLSIRETKKHRAIINQNKR